MKQGDFPKSALVLLAALVAAEAAGRHIDPARISSKDAELLVAADLACRDGDGLHATEAGRARLRRQAAADGDIDPFRAQHLNLAHRIIAASDGHADVIVDESESPLAWLARRKGRGGAPLIDAAQLQAGEQLRGDFTRAQMTPRVTANWDTSIAQGRRGQGGAGTFSDVVVASRKRLRHALDAVGPEFSGLLLDVCCFLKGLEDIERERRWPPRSAKVVVQLALDCLARHYGLANEARGRQRVAMRRWDDGECSASV